MVGSRTRPDPSELALPPSPDELPLLGSTVALMRDPTTFLDDISRYGDVVTYRIAGARFTALLDPQDIETVLLKKNDRFSRWAGEEWGDTFAGYAEQGLLLSTGEQWRRQRLLIQSVFTPDLVETYAEAMVEETNATIDDWSGQRTVDLRRDLSDLTLRILTRTLFDVEIEGRGAVVRRAGEAINQRADARNLSTFLPPWLPTPTNRRIHSAMDDLERLIDELIADRRTAPGEHDDLLSLMLAAETDDHPSFDRNEIKDNLITFLFAGHETTALALTYTLHLLAHHPSEAHRVRAELDTVNDGRPPSPVDLSALQATENVIKESLRLYPPVYALFREATTDVAIGRYRIPAGSKVTLPQIRVQRDPRLFPDPETFIPQRWTADFESTLPDYAYFPFGGGPRHCIGMRFAMTELQVVLPMILSEFIFEPQTELEVPLRTGITLQPRVPVEVDVAPR